MSFHSRRNVMGIRHREVPNVSVSVTLFRCRYIAEKGTLDVLENTVINVMIMMMMMVEFCKGSKGTCSCINFKIDQHLSELMT